MASIAAQGKSKTARAVRRTASSESRPAQVILGEGYDDSGLEGAGALSSNGRVI